MGSNGTHKNKTHLEKVNKSKVNIRIGKGIRKNQQPPFESTKKLEKSWFMVVEISALVPRYQLKKPKFNSSYGYGVFGKCANMSNACTFGAFLHVITYFSITVTQIELWFFVLIPWYRDISTTINPDFFPICFCRFCEGDYNIISKN